MNKDLILREYLAIERSRMANQRTLLTYVRTGLYFLIAGSTIGEFIDTSFWRIMDIPLIAAGILLMVVGIIIYRINQIKIEKSMHQIGKIKDDFIKDLKLDDL